MLIYIYHLLHTARLHFTLWPMLAQCHQLMHWGLFPRCSLIVLTTQHWIELGSQTGFLFILQNDLVSTALFGLLYGLCLGFHGGARTQQKQLPANHWLDSKVCLYGVTPWKTASVWSHFWSKRYRVQLYIPQIYMYQWWPLLRTGVTVSAVFAPGLPTLLALSGSQCQWAEG